MADKRWVSTNGALDANDSWSPVNVPVGGDSWFFSDLSAMDVVSGLAVFAAVDTTRIWFDKSYPGNIGAAGNSLRVPVGFLIHNGSGSLHHYFVTHGTLATNIVIDSPNQQDAYSLDAGGDANCILACLGGATVLRSGAGPLSALFVGSARMNRGPEVTIESSFGAITYYRQTGGFVTTKSDLGSAPGSCVIDGGTLIYDALGTDIWTMMEITGGRVEYNGSGGLSFCIVNSGTLDMTNDLRAKTITVLVLMPGSAFLTHSNITVGHLYDYRVSPPLLDVTLP